MMKAQILHKNGRKIIDLNRRKAIRFKCCDCSGWMLREVTKCSFTECPLYPFRSGQGKQNSNKRAKAIRFYCLSCMNGQRYEVKKCSTTDCPIHPYRQTTVDRTGEIVPLLSKKGHIETLSGRKNERQYQRVRGAAYD